MYGKDLLSIGSTVSKWYLVVFSAVLCNHCLIQLCQSLPEFVRGPKCGVGAVKFFC